VSRSALVALLQRRLGMWLVLQRIVAGMGRAVRRLRERARLRPRPGTARAQPLTPHVRG
jgi:hypothetical protein